MAVQFKGSIQDMVTEYNTLNVKARITGVAYQMMLLRVLPQLIFMQLTTINPAGKTDDKLQEIILTAEKNVEVWQATEKNFIMINKPSKSTRRISKSGAIHKRPAFRQPRRFENNRPQYEVKTRDTMYLQTSRRKNIRQDGRRGPQVRNRMKNGSK
jgi:hypothetical protein